jgi:hypothetical protein
MDRLDLIRATAATAALGFIPAVEESPNSSAFRQLRQLRQGYIDSWNSPLSEMYGEKHIKGFEHRRADPAGPAVSLQHQRFKNGSALKAPCRPAVLRRSARHRSVSPADPAQHQILLPAKVTSFFPNLWSVKMTSSLQMPRHTPYMKILTREEADIPNWYAAWADVFAVVSSQLVHDAAGDVLRRSKDLLLAIGWKPAHKPNCFQKYVSQDSEASLWVDRYPRGWIIELSRPDLPDPASRILTTVLGDIPILCPSFQSAAQLAEACYPVRDRPHRYPVYWHHYW